MPDSINDPMNHYKVNDDGVMVLAGDGKIDLFLILRRYA